MKRVLQQAEQGEAEIDFKTYDTDWDSDAYLTVSGQNSNNSVRVTDAFLKAVREDGDWTLTRRTDGKVVKTVKARDLWEKVGLAAWACADPGVQFHDTINAWHTCPADGPIRASNPCSEYMFLDDTACNLASMNLLDLPQGRPLRRPRLRPRHPPLDAGPRDLRPDGAVPEPADRRAHLPLPHPRPRLRQHRRPADDHGLRLRLRPRAAPSAAPSPPS